MSMLFREYNFVYWLGKIIVKLGFLLFSRLEVRNEKNVPRQGGVLLVANHISHLDPPVVGITCARKVYFLAKKELFKNGLIGWFMNSSGQIKVDRGKGLEAVEAAVNTLKAGKCICIFPEGTRSRTGQMQQPHTGIVVIASKINVPIVPILVEGTYQMLPPKAKFPKFFSRIRLTYGESFYLTEEQMDLSSKDKMRETAEAIMEKIRVLGTQ
jgi:1-acyl-sn-glycerol-3-phosphate acyltransferase